MAQGPQIQMVPVSQVVIPKRRRITRDIDGLAESIGAVGLLNPITVTDSLRLVAGYHRLEACRLLGWSELPALVRTLGELDAELAEIDENLIRNELNDLERGEHHLRRKEIYEARHPETQRGGDRKSIDYKSKRHYGALISAFSKAAASKTGQAKRTIQRLVHIAQAIPEPVRDVLRPLPIADHQAELLKIARIADAKTQNAVASLIAEDGAKTVSRALVLLRRQQAAGKGERAPKARGVEILTGDFRAVMPRLRADSVDLIFTDPPYDKAALPLYGELAREAKRVLRDGGSLIAYVGHHGIQRVLNDMAEHLSFWWLLAVAHAGGSTSLSNRRVFVRWKPMVWFVKGTRRGTAAARWWRWRATSACRTRRTGWSGRRGRASAGWTSW